ncbi:MAG: glycosyltransferase [Thermoanaerobaculia bacterium]|nr:glycosyltransferase [Thermoanaerobaculia bacterium]
MGWNKWLMQRRALEEHLIRARPYDLIDVPPVSVSPAVAQVGGIVVARSVQPDLLYLESERRASAAGGRRALPWRLLSGLLAAPLTRAIKEGWHLADVVLCLGSLELAWMKGRFPSLRERLAAYVVAPPTAERQALAAVAAARSGFRSGLVRWLWLGRWAAHKGVGALKELIGRRLAVTDDRFTIAGCGEVPVRELDPEWTGSGRVRVVPSFDRSELTRLLADHDAGLFTSGVEGWGLSVQEMLESGLPVYASPAGCVGDLAPFVESGLEPFPPPLKDCSPARVALEPGYWGQFEWDRIAMSYEEMMVSKGARRPLLSSARGAGT